MICCILLEEGAGVGGRGVGSGVGASVWLMFTGMMKSYDATSVGANSSWHFMVEAPITVALNTPGCKESSDSVKVGYKVLRNLEMSH